MGTGNGNHPNRDMQKLTKITTKLVRLSLFKESEVLSEKNDYLEKDLSLYRIQINIHEAVDRIDCFRPKTVLMIGSYIFLTVFSHSLV